MRGRAYFNAKAHEWDTYMPTEETERAGALLRTLPIRPGDAVLDVGCGTGVIVPFLKGIIGEEGHIVAIDYAEKMLSHARVKMPSEAAFVAADIHSVPLVSESFSVAVCFNCFPHFHDKARAFIELERVLSTGGVLIICHSRSREGINALHREVGDVVREDRIPDAATMRELFTHALFTNLTIENAEQSYTAIGWKGGA